MSRVFFPFIALHCICGGADRGGALDSKAHVER